MAPEAHAVHQHGAPVFTVKTLLSPDVALALGSGLLLFGTIILIGWIVNDGTPASRIILSAIASIAWTAIMAVFRIPAVRILLYELRYLVSGPTYEIEAGGAIKSGSSLKEQELLDLGWVATKKIYTNAMPQAGPTNRMVIKANRSQTIRIDIPAEDGECLLGWGEDDDAGRVVEFFLWGYGGKAKQVKAALDKEICPFITRLTAELQAGHEGQNFWVRITTQGENPFLRFYLRDVPSAEVSSFQLHLTDKFAEGAVSVAIQENGLRIAANAPDALANSVRSYLSSPALAHRDDG